VGLIVEPAKSRPVFLDLFCGGIENWFAYVLALCSRWWPQGLFGERIIERV
jgi:hypothetical protein